MSWSDNAIYSCYMRSLLKNNAVQRHAHVSLFNLQHAMQLHYNNLEKRSINSTINKSLDQLIQITHSMFHGPLYT